MRERVQDDTPTEALLAAGVALDALLESHWESFAPHIAHVSFVSRFRRELLALRWAVRSGLTIKAMEQRPDCAIGVQAFTEAAASINQVWKLCRASYHGHLQEHKHLKALLITSPCRPDVLTDVLFILKHLPARLVQRRDELLGRHTIAHFIADAERQHEALRNLLGRVLRESGTFDLEDWPEMPEDVHSKIARDIHLALMASGVDDQAATVFIDELKQRSMRGAAPSVLEEEGQDFEITPLYPLEVIALATFRRNAESYRSITRIDIVEALGTLAGAAHAPPAMLKALGMMEAELLRG